jgi:RimJ/RimL family protein N-acetyltransferase
MTTIIETERLYIRRLKRSDFIHLNKLFKDEVLMAFEHPFSNEEVKQWISMQIKRYKKDGFGLWAVIEKNTNAFIGECGLTTEKINDEEYFELEYLLDKDYWHRGYAAEMAFACRDYAFNILNVKNIYSIIHIHNFASQKVARKIGMKIEKEIMIENFYGQYVEHFVFSINK